MIEPSDPIENPLIGHEFWCLGHRLRLIQSTRDADDGSLWFDYSAPPGAGVPEHIHHHQEERFEVLSGTLGVRLGGRELTLDTGQKVTGAPGVPHAWWNPNGDEEVHILVGIRPGLEIEILFETLFGLARDGKTVGQMVPRNPLQLAVVLDGTWNWGHFTAVPEPIWKVLFAPVALLALVGRTLGYRARHL
jgi:hypothetical protein